MYIFCMLTFELRTVSQNSENYSIQRIIASQPPYESGRLKLTNVQGIQNSLTL